MNKDNQEFVNSLLQRLAKLNYIKPGDVPNIDLYMDQVTTFMDEHLSDISSAAVLRTHKIMCYPYKMYAVLSCFFLK